MIEALFILFVFRDFLGKFLPYGEYYFICLAVIGLSLKLGSMSTPKPLKSLTFFNLYIFIILIPSIFQVGIIPSTIGILNLTLFLNFFLLDYTIDKERLNRCLKYTAIILSIGTIIQFFVHPTIFGLLQENMFTNEKYFENINFTKRGVSFIKSPQTLGFVFFLFMAWSYMKNPLLKALIFIAGVLTFSKSFFFPLLLYYSIKNFKAGIFIFPAATGIAIYFKIFELSNFQRILDIPLFLTGFLESERFLAYNQFFDINNAPQLFIGNGIGSLSRGAEQLTGNSILSSESFLLQLFYETGFFGLFLIGLIYYETYKKLSNAKLLLMIAILVSLFTPSLYGFSASLIFYSIIKSELFNGIFNPNECLSKGKA